MKIDTEFCYARHYWILTYRCLKPVFTDPFSPYAIAMKLNCARRSYPRSTRLNGRTVSDNTIGNPSPPLSPSEGRLGRGFPGALDGKSGRWRGALAHFAEGFRMPCGERWAVDFRESVHPGRVYLCRSLWHRFHGGMKR